jgi:hypothetical protein
MPLSVINFITLPEHCDAYVTSWHEFNNYAAVYTGLLSLEPLTNTSFHLRINVEPPNSRGLLQRSKKNYFREGVRSDLESRWSKTYNTLQSPSYKLQHLTYWTHFVRSALSSVTSTSKRMCGQTSDNRRRKKLKYWLDAAETATAQYLLMDWDKTTDRRVPLFRKVITHSPRISKQATLQHRITLQSHLFMLSSLAFSTFISAFHLLSHFCPSDISQLSNFCPSDI